MNGYAYGRAGSAAAVLAITASVVLAGCGGSSGTSGSLASGGSSSSPASSSTKPAGSGGSSSPAGSSVTTATTLPFPVGVGDTWTYKTTFGQTVNTMTAVKPVAGGQQVTMATTATVDGTTTRNTGYYVVHSNGEISLPFSQFATGSSSATVKLISGGVFWPSAAQLAAGQTSHSTIRIQFSESGVTQKVDAHIAVKGAGTQSVTVPAGTYNATVVNMTMSESIEGIAVSTQVRTWLATGVGPVQTEVILDEGGTDHVTVKDQLVSFKAG
jgi:hypothetical protein